MRDILLLGPHYGTVFPETDTSPTHDEHTVAVRRGIQTLTLAEGMRDASAWFFHHDEWAAHNGIDVHALVRVWMSSVKAPR